MENLKFGIQLDPLPILKKRSNSIPHAPKRKHNLNEKEIKKALINSLRFFPKKFQKILLPEFKKELEDYGHIYMYRFKPDFKIKAYPVDLIPSKSRIAACIMHMIMNNLDPEVAQFPEELITYGGNGAVFSNWVQFQLTMEYLTIMTDEQTLSMYSGTPMGLFPSHKLAPRVVITNGMIIPAFSDTETFEKLYAMGCTMYGQMTAGSYCYIGPMGIVHGTTLTLLNAGRKYLNVESLKGKVFVSAGLGGMSGAQGKAGVIAGAVTVIAEINSDALEKRQRQGWLMESYTDLDLLLDKITESVLEEKSISLGYLGNVVDLWEKLVESDIKIHLGSDQTSLHNPFNGGYYPVGLSFEESNKLMVENPILFKTMVEKSLIRHVKAINKLTLKCGMRFFDYGNAFLLQSGLAGADIFKEEPEVYKYPSYVEDIMGPMIFDYGFGPFRWVCTSGKESDLQKTDEIAANICSNLALEAPPEIKQQYLDNYKWIKAAEENKLVVGSQARILYSDEIGRTQISLAFNKAVRDGLISSPIVISRDHHDVSGTDSPFRETSSILDGSNKCADMAIQNVIGCSFRGAHLVAIHNGGGVGWSYVMNGGFQIILDGSEESDTRVKQMLFWDVNNGIQRRAWAGSEGSKFSINRAMKRNPLLKITKNFSPIDLI